MPTLPRYLAALPALAYPFAAHFASARQSLPLTLVAMALLAAAVLIPSLLRGRLFAWIALLCVAAGLWLLSRAQNTQLPLYLPPVLVPAFLAWGFGHTLTRGNTPLVAQLVRLLHPPQDSIDPDVWSYARRLTWIWALLLAMIAVVNLTLAALVTPDGLLLAAGVVPPFTVALNHWSVFANLIGYLLVAAFFVVEYAYRRRRFPQQPYRNFFDFVRRSLAATPELFKSRGSE